MSDKNKIFSIKPISEPKLSETFSAGGIQIIKFSDN